MTKVKFSNENRNGLLSVKNNTRDELVRGLLDITLKDKEFDCTDRKFHVILDELIRKYGSMKQNILVKTSENPAALPQPLIRNIINVNTMLIYTLEESKKQNISEINLSTYLTKLLQNTNEIFMNYSGLLKSLEYRKTILEKIRDVKIFGKIFAGLALIFTLHKGINKESYIKDGDNPKEKTEIAAPKTINGSQTKIISVNPKKTEKSAETIKDTTKQDIYSIPKAPAGFKYYKTVTAKVTAYNPTGPGLMAQGYPERGITSTGRNAINHLDGVAVDPKLIPYGSMVYIINKKSRNIWKIADDTGHLIKEDSERGITHIDIRMENYKRALNYGKKYLTIHIFVPNGVLNNLRN